MAGTLAIRGGTVVDGSGRPGHVADVLIEGDRVVAVGSVPLENGAAEIIDATGLVVSPGFINMLSHAWGSLQRDPTGASDLLQGVTTEVLGEAFSLGPSDHRIRQALSLWDDLENTRVEFEHLSEGLDHLTKTGLTMNVASFIGGVNLRLLGAGFADRPLTTEELDRVCAIVAEEMQDGALGVGTALIYAPNRFARTDELVEICRVVGRYNGTYISHLRSEGDQLLECLDELLDIGQQADCRVEVYHLKAAGRRNWPRMTRAIERIDQARARGQRVGANMYPYNAGGTSLAACIPPRFHVGGPLALRRRLMDRSERRAMVSEMQQPSTEFENLFLGCGGAGILLLDDLPDRTPARGRQLSEIAADLGVSEPEALLDIVTADPSRGAIYFLMHEDNVRLGLRQPWVSIGSDGQAHPAVPPFTDRATHPRTYGTFARVLGHYSRDLQMFPLEEAIRRMTSLPAEGIGLDDRGRLVPGAFADLVLFDADTVADTATYDEPHRYARGVHHVVVNGEVVVRDGQVTSARPGRRLRRAR